MSADRSPSTDAWSYLAGLARGLRGEVERALPVGPERSALLAEIEALARELPVDDEEPGPWRACWRRYRSLVHAKAALLNSRAEVARVYASMDELWADADAQAAGASPYTFWDTYEHGRRRQLEAQLARAYGTPGALLLNTGMSAIAVALGSLSLRRGARLLTGERSYFETSDYLERFVAPLGIEVIRAPIGRPGALVEALRTAQPEVALLETVINAPGVAALRDVAAWADGSLAPSTFLLIDNTVQSHLTRWPRRLEGRWEHALVIESGTKYLTQECAAGVLYGGGEALERARDFARATGQQLQEKAFNFLGEAEIDRVHERLRLHAGNARSFVAALREASPSLTLDTLDAQPAAPDDRAFLFGDGVGPLVFLTLPAGKVAPEAAHRSLLAVWQRRARQAGLDFDIRAGFGWTGTSARVYESTRLNQKDAPSYLRISVGLEPAAVVRGLAASLAAAVREVCGEEAAR